MTLLLTPGTVCVANGQTIQIDGCESLTHMRVRVMATGAMQSVPIAQIEELPTPAAPTSNSEEISDAEWERCVALAKDLAPSRDSARLKRSELVSIARRHHIGVRQLQRIRAVFLKDSRVSALARKPGGRPLGLNQLPPDVDTVIRHTVHKHYFRRERPPKSHIVARVQSLARRLKLPVPSRRAVLTRIAREAGWLADRARLGSKAAKQKWEVRTGQLRVAEPLDLIQIDHTLADVIVLSEDRRRVIGRPWVTLAIDVFSRCVLGMYIGMEAPSATSIALCIEHAVLPKRENHDDPTLWPMYGKPRQILVDNGKDFRSDALKRGCEEHGIDLVWRPVRTPHYGGHIERLIGTLMHIAHLLPGTTFSNIQQRGDYDSEKRARLTLAEFRQWITQKICRFYHPRKHRGLGIPPLIAWERGLTNAAGVFMAPALFPRPLEFRMDFLPTARRKVRRTGVEFQTSRYWHDDLSPLLNSDNEPLLRFDPWDSSQIWMRLPNGVLVTAPAIAGPGAGQRKADALDAATKARLNAEIDRGFEATDRIDVSANRDTKRARRMGPRGGRKAAKTRPANPLYISAPPPRSSRGSVAMPIEEWD